MILQRREGRVWVGVIEGGKVVKSPVDINEPPGVYQLREK